LSKIREIELRSLVNKVDSLLIKIKVSESRRVTYRVMRQLWKTQLSDVVMGSALKSASANPVLILMGPVQFLPFKKFRSNLPV
jgi:hypothetical protein